MDAELATGLIADEADKGVVAGVAEGGCAAAELVDGVGEEVVEGVAGGDGLRGGVGRAPRVAVVDRRGGEVCEGEVKAVADEELELAEVEKDFSGEAPGDEDEVGGGGGGVPKARGMEGGGGRVEGAGADEGEDGGGEDVLGGAGGDGV